MLVGKRIILRTVRESDLPKLYQLRADVRNLGGVLSSAYTIRVPRQETFQ